MADMVITTENRAVLLKTKEKVCAEDIIVRFEGEGGGGSDPLLQEKTVTPTTLRQDVTPDSNYDGLSKVVVNPIPSDYVVPVGTKQITNNGMFDVGAVKYANVNVPAPTPVTYNLTVTKNGTYLPANYNVGGAAAQYFSRVQVNVPTGSSGATLQSVGETFTTDFNCSYGAQISSAVGGNIKKVVIGEGRISEIGATTIASYSPPLNSEVGYFFYSVNGPIHLKDNYYETEVDACAAYFYNDGTGSGALKIIPVGGGGATVTAISYGIGGNGTTYLKTNFFAEWFVNDVVQDITFTLDNGYTAYLGGSSSSVGDVGSLTYEDQTAEYGGGSTSNTLTGLAGVTIVGVSITMGGSADGWGVTEGEVLTQVIMNLPNIFSLS